MPIVLQGFPIGTLTPGSRSTFLRAQAELSGGEIVIGRRSDVIASTPAAADTQRIGALLASGPERGGTVRLDGEQL